MLAVAGTTHSSEPKIGTLAWLRSCRIQKCRGLLTDRWKLERESLQLGLPMQTHHLRLQRKKVSFLCCIHTAGACARVEEKELMLYTHWNHSGPGEPDKPSSSKKRRRSTSLSSLASPSNLFKPGLTERQQMAILIQMTDPQKQTPGHLGSKHAYPWETWVFNDWMLHTQACCLLSPLCYCAYNLYGTCNVVG